MAIATLMATCAMFLVAGWTRRKLCGAGAHHRRRGLHRRGQWRRHVAGPQDRLSGRRDAVEAANRADHRRDGLGFRRRRHAQADESRPGANTSRCRSPWTSRICPTALQVETQNYAYQGKSYMLINALGSSVVPDGKYLYDADTHRIEIQWVQGIGSDKAAAPQARLMATVINGILNRQAALAARAAGRFPGDRDRAAGRSFAALCRGLVSFHRHDGRPFSPEARCAGSSSAAARSGDGKRNRPGPALRQRTDRRRRHLRAAGHRDRALEDPEFRYHIFRPGLFQLGPKIMGACGEQPYLRLADLRAACGFAVLLRTEKVGVGPNARALLLSTQSRNVRFCAR